MFKLWFFFYLFIYLFFNLFIYLFAWQILFNSDDAFLLDELKSRFNGTILSSTLS